MSDRAHFDSAGDAPPAGAEPDVRRWRGVLRGASHAAIEHGLPAFAAATAYYTLLAVPASLSAAISALGLAFGGHEVGPGLDTFKGRVPDEAFGFVEDQFQYLISQPRAALILSCVISAVVALWSSLSAAQSLVSGLNAAYGCRERRTRTQLYGTLAAITAAAMTITLTSLILIVLGPIAIELLPAGGTLRTVLGALRWPAAVVLFGFGIAVTYRFAPSRDAPEWRWVSWGAVAALAIWLTVSVLFSLYVTRYANYQRVYGSFAGVALLMIWLHASALAIILGAEINAQIERRSRCAPEDIERAAERPDQKTA